MRYRLRASFNEEQRRGFIVTHTIDQEFDDNMELNKAADNFLSSYNHDYCHHMDFHITEQAE